MAVLILLSAAVTASPMASVFAAGTAQLPLDKAAAFFGAELVKAGNPVGAALSSKAALSAQGRRRP